MNVIKFLIAASGIFLINSKAFATDNAIERKIAQLNSAPSWQQMNDENVAILGKQLMDVIKPVQEWTIEDVHQLVSQLEKQSINEGQKWRYLGDIYIINRFYTNVPEWADRKSIKIFGGWAIPRKKTDQINVLYPLSISENYDLEITGGSRMYNGPPYNGLGEFEYFIRKFGKRNFPSTKN